MTTPETIERLLTQNEGINLEFKQARTNLPTDIFESVCAFLNRQGGHLLLGVRNDGTPVGVVEEAADASSATLWRLAIILLSFNPSFC